MRAAAAGRLGNERGTIHIHNDQIDAKIVEKAGSIGLRRDSNRLGVR